MGITPKPTETQGCVYEKGNASALRKGRYSQPNQIYHLVLATYHRQPFFSDYLLARHAEVSLRMSQKSVLTLAFVVMSDHIQWLIQLGDGIYLPSAVKMLKALISRKLEARFLRPCFTAGRGCGRYCSLYHSQSGTGRAVSLSKGISMVGFNLFGIIRVGVGAVSSPR